MIVDMQKPFVVLAITRADLLKGGMPQRSVEALTDQDMEEITADIAKTYQEGGFFDAVIFYAKFHVVFQEETNNATNSSSQTK